MKEYFLEIFPGIGEMANLHPVVVHFPIALLTGFVVAELISVLIRNDELRIASKWMLYFGTIGAIGSAVVGLLGAEHVFHEGEVHMQMSQHRDYGLNVAALSVFLVLWRLLEGRDPAGISRAIQNLVGILIVVNLMLGSDIGGLMVYKYGVAVNAVPREEISENETHAHGGGIGAEIADWMHGLFEEDHVVRKHSH